MKVFAVLVFVVLAVGTLAAPAPEPERIAEKEALFEPTIGLENADLLRQKKSYAPAAPAYSAPAPAYSAPAASYSPAQLSYSAPAPSIPCSRAIVVSCAPSVAAAPCSAPAY